MKIIEWNINQKNKKGMIKDWVADEIKKIGADIIVLTEFTKAPNWNEELTDKLIDYNIFTTNKNVENEVLIAIKRNLRIEGVKELSLDNVSANFLQVIVEDNGKKYFVIGYRNRTECDKNLDRDIYEDIKKDDKAKKTELKIKQCKELGDYLQTLTADNVIVIGDFNLWGSHVKEYRAEYSVLDGYEIRSPQFEKNASYKGSFNFPRGQNQLAPLDFALCKNITVKNIDYSWNYVDRIGKKPEEMINIPVGTPDHAILILEVE